MLYLFEMLLGVPHTGLDFEGILRNIAFFQASYPKLWPKNS